MLSAALLVACTVAKGDASHAADGHDKHTQKHASSAETHRIGTISLGDIGVAKETVTECVVSELEWPKL